MTSRAPWIDHRLQASTRKPWRKIHLDYHNTPHVGSVGHGFDADEFIATLRDGHVDGIVVFAKDMHGYFYYPSKRGPVHPGLHRDLLGEQVAACRANGIAVYGYYCTTWDNYLADRHPEWLVFDRNRDTYLPKFDETPRWTALCLSNEDFVEHILADSAEFLQGYELDGIWYDMPLPIGGECFCWRCREAIKATGGDPFDTATQRAHKQELMTSFMRQAKDLAERLRPGCQVDHNNQTRIGLGERAEYLDSIDIEALPTGGWGYHYFPVNVRYARNFGRPTYGQTGRFQRSWADFGGLKHPRQLAVEAAGIVAQGGHCCVGDQAPPSGQLDRAVYRTIGTAYAAIEQLEEYLEGAAPVTEAAIVVAGNLLTDMAAVGAEASFDDGTRGNAESVVGIAELLSEHRIQFDVVEGNVELGRYRLLVVPDGIPVDAELAKKLTDFTEKGGALIACGPAAAIQGSSRSWLPGIDLEVRGPSPFTPAYLIPEKALLDDFQYALYDGTEQWEVTLDDTTEVWAHVGEPAFQRAPEHFTSHHQSPFERATGLAAVVRKGSVAGVSFPLGRSYHRSGYWAYGAVFGAMLDAVLPERLIRSDAPRGAEISLTQQVIDEKPRWIIHVVNVTTNRKWGSHLESFEDVVPLTDLVIRVNVPGGATRARCAGSENDHADITCEGDNVILALPRVDTHAVVVLDH